MRGTTEDGSSPRMRGTRTVNSGSRRRFIPAHAGNSPALTLGLDTLHVRFIPAHAGNSKYRAFWQSGISSPRMRGTPPPRRCIDAGSSPRMRGTQLHSTLDVGPCGSSPRMRGTHALMARSCGRVSRNGSSPRMRGTRATGSRHPLRNHSGSSPRMRGTPRQAVHLWTVQGVHPRACGELRVPMISIGRLTVHPRACGELQVVARLANMALTVHPRACGELTSSSGSMASQIGSSPRMRGTLLRARYWPVPAGSSPRMRGTLFLHPRACGELSS